MVMLSIEAEQSHLSLSEVTMCQIKVIKVNVITNHTAPS